MSIYYGTFPKHSLRANMLQPIYANDAGEASELMKEYHGPHYNVILSQKQFEMQKDTRFANHKHYVIIMSPKAEVAL